MMRLFEMLSPDFRHEDERGELVQLVQEGFVQMNVLKTHKGVCRGGHYHNHISEAFYVVEGSVEAMLSLEGNISKYVFRVGDFFLIPPRVVHSFFFPEECTMVVLYDQCVMGGDGQKDIHSEME